MVAPNPLRISLSQSFGFSRYKEAHIDEMIPFTCIPSEEIFLILRLKVFFLSSL